jgi:hypothetical protein
MSRVTTLLYLILLGVAVLIYLFFRTRDDLKQSKLLNLLS